MSTLLIYGARQLLTLHGPSGPRRGPAMRDLGIIQDGAVLIVDGRIREAGPSRRVENLAGARLADRAIDASGRVVMPGFVDSNTHLICGSPRLTDYEMRIAGATDAEIESAGGGLRWTARAVRAAASRRLFLDAKKTLRQFYRHGTTTLEAKSGYGLDESSEIKLLKVMRSLNNQPIEIVSTYLGAHFLPDEFAGRAAGYVEWMCRIMLPQLRRRKLASFVDISCSEGVFSHGEVREYLECARNLGFKIKMQAEAYSRLGFVPLAIELGAIGIDRLEHANEEDARLLSNSQVVATLLPGPAYHRGLDCYPRARMLIDHGVAVALATGFDPGLCPTISMAMILSLACTNMRMSPAEAVSAATINGAHALHRGATAGSLEAGKSGDLVIFDVPDYREIPYHFGVNLVHAVVKNGEVLFAEKEPDWQDD
jgi:imidazolonepropionase